MENSMKKLMIIAILLSLAAIPAFSFGVGGAFGLDFAGGSVGPGALFSFSPDEIPAVFGVGFSFGTDSFALGVTADWWLYYTNLFSIVALYIGPGAYVDINIANGAARLGAGLRIPVGLQAWVLDPLELFLEVAPTFGLKNGTFPAFGVQGAIGFRFWF